MVAFVTWLIITQMAITSWCPVGRTFVHGRTALGFASIDATDTIIPGETGQLCIRSQCPQHFTEVNLSPRFPSSVSAEIAQAPCCLHRSIVSFISSLPQNSMMPRVVHARRTSRRRKSWESMKPAAPGFGISPVMAVRQPCPTTCTFHTFVLSVPLVFPFNASIPRSTTWARM